jgi:hypothetical protein
MERRSSRFIHAALTLISIGVCAFGLPAPAMAQTVEKQAVSFDLLVTNATIVTMDPDRRVIEDGAIGVNGDSIAFDAGADR